MAMRIKKGDQVIVITGRDKGKTGEVIKSMPKENKVIVQGINLVKRHTKPTQESAGGIVSKEAPIGNPDFLNQLQQGTATLYSTFHNDEVGAALAINVDGNKKSYIVIDYKNLKILKAQENKTLDAL